jgi:hypothetical protein
MSVRTASGGKAMWAAGVGGTNFVEIPEVRVWNLRISDDAKQYASSSTGGGKRRIAGAEDFSGSMSVYVDRSGTGTNDAGFDVTLGIKGGAYGVLKLYEDATAFYQGGVYISDVAVSADIEGGGILPAEISFERDSALVYPTA